MLFINNDDDEESTGEHNETQKIDDNNDLKNFKAMDPKNKTQNDFMSTGQYRAQL